MESEKGFRNHVFKNGKVWVAGIPNKVLDFILKKKWLLFAGFFVVLASIIFGINIPSAFVVIFLTLIASFSTYYKKYVKFTLGFELVTFATVLCTVKFGFSVGALVGLVSSFAAEFIPQLIDPSSFFWILSLPVSALVVSFLYSSGVGIFWLGLIAIAVQFVISEPIRLFSGDEYMKTMGTVNILLTTAWTIVIFKFIVPIVFSIL